MTSLRVLCHSYFETNLSLFKANSSANISASLYNAKLSEVRRQLEEICASHDEDVYNVEERYQSLQEVARNGLCQATEELDQLNNVKMPELQGNIEHLRRLVGIRDEQILDERARHGRRMSEVELRLHESEEGAAELRRKLAASESILRSLVEVVVSQSAEKARRFIRNNNIG